MTEIEISKAMAQLLDELGRVATAAKEVVEAIFECGKIDKLEDEQIRELITTTLKKRELSDRTIRSYLPATLKDKRAQEIGAKGNSSQSKPLRQSLPQQLEKTTVKASTTLEELEYNLASDVKKALEQVKPPVEPDNINPPDEQSTDEPDDGTEYKGDAGNNPNLVNKYIDDSPMKFKVLMPKKFIGTIFAINSNFGKVADFDVLLTIEGDRVTEVSSRPIMRAIVK